MGQARRRKQQLGALYGTPKGSSLMCTSIVPATAKRLQALGELALGCQVDGDPFWEWLSLEIRSIAGDLSDNLLEKAVRIVVKAMKLRGEEAETAGQILWCLSHPDARGSLQDHAERLQREIAHCGAKANLYAPSNL